MYNLIWKSLPVIIFGKIQEHLHTKQCRKLVLKWHESVNFWYSSVNLCGTKVSTFVVLKCQLWQSMYNLIWTSLPVIMFGILDRDLEDKVMSPTPLQVY